MNRLEVIESRLELDTASSSVVDEDFTIPPNDPEDPTLFELWGAVAQLKGNTHQPVNIKIWLPSNIQQLWQLFGPPFHNQYTADVVAST